jgi:hypothetical protein
MPAQLGAPHRPANPLGRVAGDTAELVGAGFIDVLKMGFDAAHLG